MDLLTPILGGVLNGAGSLLALAAAGKVPGISGVVARLLRPERNDTRWRIVFLVGLVIGAGLAHVLGIGWQGYTIPGARTLVTYCLAGLLVGFGTRMARGCTSGHGICGVGAGARDALVYTLTFMATGVLTVLLFDRL